VECKLGGIGKVDDHDDGIDLEANMGRDENYLFQSRRQETSVSTVSGLAKRWTISINLKGNYGTHSLGKAFGYIQRINYKVAFEVLTKRFDNPSPSVTMRYLGIQDKEINGILLNEI
jgi:hypothetical protein